jgi:PEP-CTERM motif
MMQFLLTLRNALIVASLSIATSAHAQYYQGWFHGVVTKSEFWFVGHENNNPINFNFDGHPIFGDFTIDQRHGSTDITYAAELPLFSFSGATSDSDVNPFDRAEFNTNDYNSYGVLIASPDLGAGSNALFALVFDLSTANNPSVLFGGYGQYEFFYSYDPAASSYFRGYIQFSFNDGALSATPEPSQWIMLIGGMGLAGAALRSRRRPHHPTRIA